MNLVYLPPWSTKLIAGIALALLVLAAVRWWRESRGGPLLAVRACIIGLLILVMLNPQALLPRERTEKPKLAILLDTSASMATRDLGTDSRLAAALRTLTNPVTLATLNRDFVLDVRRFDREAHPADLAQLGTNTPAGDATDLGKAVMSVASELGETKAQAGVLVVSDGRATTPDTVEAAQLALARSVPLWTWTLGGPVPRHDLWVETASAEALAFSGARSGTGSHAA